MLNNKIVLTGFAALLCMSAVHAEEDNRSVFQRIADMEQDKVLMQLEKEREQLQLDLDRLSVERLRMQVEAANLSGAGGDRERELEDERRRLEAEKAAFERSKTAPAPVEQQKPQKPETNDISRKYKLAGIVGAGNQLQATVEEVSNGRTRRVWVGRDLDGYEVTGVSLDDGVTLKKGSEIINLGTGGK